MSVPAGILSFVKTPLPFFFVFSTYKYGFIIALAL